jgi:sterol desaturase/sphingolipid hydroxylase (fatty acid hydroxylase superfamily)
MLLALFLIPLTFLITCLFGYWFHRFLHSPKAGVWYESHRHHHEILYPFHDCFSDTYREAGKHSTTWIFLISGSPLIILPVVLWATGILALWLAGVILAEVLLIGLLNSFVHDWSHLNYHRLSKYAWFGRLVELHHLHHLDQKTNFGIFWFAFDRLFGTFKSSRI